MLRSTVAAVALLTLAACGGGGDGGTEVSSGEDLAAQLGCESAELEAQPQVYATEGGTCELGGETAYVYYFDTEENRDQWVEAATSAAGGLYLVGPNWVVQADRPVLEDVQADMGGEFSDA